MNKKIITIVVAILLTTIIGVALATCVNWNPNVFTGYVFTPDRLSDGQITKNWKYSGTERTLGYEEIRNMAEDHDVYWIHEGDISGIGIMLVDDADLLVIPTEDKRLTNGLGHYKIWF